MPLEGEKTIVELIKSQASHFLNILSEQDCAKPVWSCQDYEADFSNYTCVCLWFKKIFRFSANSFKTPLTE